MESMSRIKEELKSVERGRLSIEDEKRRLQAVLSETQKQQLASEASLQIANQVACQSIRSISIYVAHLQIPTGGVEADGDHSMLSDQLQRMISTAF